MIPYGRQDISQADIDAVVEVLRSDFLTQGPAVPQFEQALVARVGAAHGVAVNSATSALHIACLALGLGPGDLLWTTPITFVASTNCALYCGADVDFVDIDPKTYNLCPERLEEKLIEAERDGRLPKIVVPVHLCGQSCDMAAIGRLARKYGFRVIEDASHAVGGTYHDAPVGSCEHSDVTVFSFHPVKIITTAEGGLALTNQADLAERMQLLRSHGITRDPVLMTKTPDGAWYYQQVALGFNYRMTDVQAALGLSQLDRLEAFLTRRHEIADRYDRLLANLPVVVPFRAPHIRSALHLYVIRVPETGETARGPVFSHLRERGIGVNVHYIPVYHQPWYSAQGHSPNQFPEAEAYYREAISLPMFPELTNPQQDAVIAALAEALGR